MDKKKFRHHDDTKHDKRGHGRGRGNYDRNDQKSLLEIKDLVVEYTSGGAVVQAVNGVSLSLNKGETLGLVGDIYRLVGAGLGVAIMSHSESRSYDAYNVTFVDIDDGEDLNNSVVMAWANNLSPLARQFRDITQED